MVAPPVTSKYLGLEQAARSGNVEQLKAFTSKYICCMPPGRQKQLCAMAAGTGNVACLKYMHDSGAQWDEMVPMAAAGAGAIGCMEYALGMGCPFDIRVCIYAADAGQLEALRYAVGTAGQTVNTAVLYAAAAKDNPACLTYMVEDLGAKVEPIIAGVACSRGALQCLQCVPDRFLVERGVRLRANDITYTLTAVPEGGCDTPSIRSKALAMIYALNLGVRLNRKHWNTAVGASAQRLLDERRKAFYMCLAYAKVLSAAATCNAANGVGNLHIGSPEVAAPPASEAAAAAGQADAVRMRDCSSVHLPMALMPRDVAEIIARIAHLRGAART